VALRRIHCGEAAPSSHGVTASSIASRVRLEIASLGAQVALPRVVVVVPGLLGDVQPGRQAASTLGQGERLASSSNSAATVSAASGFAARRAL
jgi:hypothetical protein